MEEIRQPKQKRAIEKKEKIIDAGFKLISKNGYYNTNTKEIAKEANVSTGIVYQYFNDKHDIFMAGIKKYGDTIFYPMIKIPNDKLNKEKFPVMINDMIDEYVKSHKLSKTAHEEIMAMTHSDPLVADYYYEREINITNSITKYFIENNFNNNMLEEKVHIMIGLIDNLCHEIIYHKHEEIDYKNMKKIVIQTITNIFKNDLD